MTQVATTPDAVVVDRRASRVDRSVGIIRVLRDTVVAVGPNRPRLILLCVLSVVAGTLESLVLYVVARLALGATTGSGDIVLDIGPLSVEAVSITLVSAIAGGLLVLWVAVGFPVARLSSGLSAATLVRLRRELIEAYITSPWAEVSKDHEGRFQELAGDYCYRSERLVQIGTVIVVAGINIVVILLVAVVIAPVGALAAVAVLGGLGVLLRPIAQRVRSGTTAFSRTNRQFNGRVAQTARVAQEVAAFDVGDAVTEWLDADIVSAGHSIRRMRFSTAYMPMLYQFGALAFVIGLAGVMSSRDPASIIVLAPVLLLLIRVLGYGRQLQNAVQAGVELTPYIDGLLSEIDRLRASHTPAGTQIVESPTPLVFSGVAFAYVSGHDVVRDVDIAVHAGDTVGVVGPSGGGKSTLTQLLLNLRSPTRGSIVAAGVPLHTIDESCWAELVALVPQDNKLVHGSVADNVRFFRPALTDAAVEQAVRAAHLHDEILALPEGYDTVVGPGARELSGGQRQRLGIARGLVGQPKLLILDEPTSALDSRSEELIRQTLEELARAVTLIVVAHRPATLEICRRLLVVRDGQVVETDPATYHGSIE